MGYRPQKMMVAKVPEWSHNTKRLTASGDRILPTELTQGTRPLRQQLWLHTIQTTCLCGTLVVSFHKALRLRPCALLKQCYSCTTQTMCLHRITNHIGRNIDVKTFLIAWGCSLQFWCFTSVPSLTGRKVNTSKLKSLRLFFVVCKPVFHVW